MIRGIIWDFAGVLLHTIRGTFNSMMAERLEVPVEHVNRVMSGPENDLWDLGEIDDNTFFDYIISDIGLSVEKKAALASFVRDDFYVDKELVKMIREMRKEYKTILLTNFPAHLHEFLETVWDVEGAFDQIIASCDVKLLKPDLRMYRLALDAVGCDAEEAVFIDDREVNVKAAREMGMEGILFKSKESAVDALNRIFKAS